MPQKWRTMLGVSIGALTAPLGLSTVSIGLPTIAQALHQDITVVEWVIVAYLLVTTALLLSFGRLGGLVSIKLLYALGFAIFTSVVRPSQQAAERAGADRRVVAI